MVEYTAHNGKSGSSSLPRLRWKW